MPLDRETYNSQSKLARFCRTGVYEEEVGAPEGRAAIYRSLVFNVIDGTLRNAYPIARSSLSRIEWKTLVDDFLSDTGPKSPVLWRMPKDLYDYVVRCDYGRRLKKPYLQDLLLFEWLEIEVHMMADIPPGPYTKEGDVLESALVVNPEFRIARLSYPVFKHSISEMDGRPGRYTVVFFRHPATLKVRIVEVNDIYADVLESLRLESKTGNDILSEAAQRKNVVWNNCANAAGKRFLEAMISEGLILGFRK